MCMSVFFVVTQTNLIEYNLFIICLEINRPKCSSSQLSCQSLVDSLNISLEFVY